jgi:hypothetical protein
MKKGLPLFFSNLPQGEFERRHFGGFWVASSSGRQLNTVQSNIEGDPSIGKLLPLLYDGSRSFLELQIRTKSASFWKRLRRLVSGLRFVGLIIF